MQVNLVNNLNFKSNIHVLCPYDFDKVTEIMSENPEYKTIYNWEIEAKDSKYEKRRAYRTNSDLISTRDVRSCTMLHTVDKGKSAPFTMHARDTQENIQNVPRLKQYVKGTNAFIIGSKRQYKESGMMFDATEKIVKEQNIPTTIMKNLKYEWQASMAYDSKLDTLFLCVNEIERPNIFVRNMRDLKRVFSKVKISPTDTIEFFTGQKKTLLQAFKSKIKGLI